MKAILWLVGALVVGLTLLAIAPFTIIDAGEVGVVTRLGAVTRTLEPGMHWLAPLTESVHKIDVRVQKEQTDADAATKDLQSVNATVAVNFTVNPEKAAELYANIGTEYKDRVIAPAIQEAVKAAASQYTAEELQTKRPQVADEIQSVLTTRLSGYFITVTDVSIVNFGYSPAFSESVETKVTAAQNALASESRLEQARNDAQAIKVKSEAANNEKYVELQRLEVEKAAIDKWNGVLPSQMIPGATLPFLNLTKTQ